MTEMMKIGAAEQRATMLARGLSSDVAAWQQLTARAYETVAAQPFGAECDVTSWYEADEAREVLSAARVLDNAAQFAPNLGGAAARRVGLQAALSFAMQGNFLTSEAIVKRTFPNLRAQSDDEAWLMLCAAPSLWPNLQIDASFAARKYLRALKMFLRSGNDADAANLRDVWQESALRLGELADWAICGALGCGTRDGSFHGARLESAANRAARLAREIAR